MICCTFRALSTPELRPDDEGRELRTEEQSGQNTGGVLLISLGHLQIL